MNNELVKMNIRLDRVLTDIGGASGMRVMEAIIEGERSPEALYDKLVPKLKKGAEKISSPS